MLVPVWRRRTFNPNIASQAWINDKDFPPHVLKADDHQCEQLPHVDGVYHSWSMVVYLTSGPATHFGGLIRPAHAYLRDSSADLEGHMRQEIEQHSMPTGVHIIVPNTAVAFCGCSVLHGGRGMPPDYRECTVTGIKSRLVLYCQVQTPTRYFIHTRTQTETTNNRNECYIRCSQLHSHRPSKHL